MLSPIYQSKFVTKILTNAAGEKYRVVFLVGLVNGEVKAQVVSATLIEAANSSSKTAVPLCLPLFKNVENFDILPTPTKGTSPSPFYNEFFFFTSQPTRAPSF